MVEELPSMHKVSIQSLVPQKNIQKKSKMHNKRIDFNIPKCEKVIDPLTIHSGFLVPLKIYMYKCSAVTITDCSCRGYRFG